MGGLAIFSAGADPKNHFFGGAVTAGGWGPFLRGALYRVSLSKIFPLSKPSPLHALAGTLLLAILFAPSR